MSRRSSAMCGYWSQYSWTLGRSPLRNRSANSSASRLISSYSREPDVDMSESPVDESRALAS